MTKRYDEDIEVAVDPYDDTGSPLAFTWRGRRYDVDDRLETWREAGEWWLAAGGNGNGSAPRDREYFRVLARPSELRSTGELDPDGFMRQIGAVYDLYRDRNARAWRLARIWD